MKTKLLLAALCSFTVAAFAATPDDGSVLPFPPTPLKDSVATPRLQDAKMKWPAPPQRLPKDAPNILIVLLDDIGSDLDSLVTLHYIDQAPFRFNGTIGATAIKYLKKQINLYVFED